MKWNIILISLLLVASSLASCTEEEKDFAAPVKFDTMADGTLIPLANLYIRTADGYIVPSIDEVPVNGVYTARFSSIDYSEKIEEVSFILPEGASINPIPAGPKDSIEIEIEGVGLKKVRNFWDKIEAYTITMPDKTTYSIAFKLEDFVAKEKAPEAEPGSEPDPNDPNNIFVDLFNGSDLIPDQLIWELCTYANNTWSQHFQYVDGYENVKIENGYLKLMVKKDNGYYKNGGIRTKSGFPNNTRLEVKAKTNKIVRGGFPAVWQMPINGLMWPTSGEIDLMEWVQSTPSLLYQTLHYSPAGINKSEGVTRVGDVTDWHIYAVERTDEALIFFIDGEETLRHTNEANDAKQYPFNRYEYDIILNFSLGGLLNGTTTWPGTIHDEDLPGELWIDWVSISKISE